MGFLNYTNTGGRRLGAQEVSQEVGWASKTYSGQNKQSFLAWSFFSCPYQSSAWSKGQGIPPINFLVGYGTELNGLFSHRAEALNHAFHDAIKEHKISEREAGRLIRHYPYEWLLFLRPDTTEDEEDAEAQRSINLMQSISRALDPAYRGPIQATEKFTPEQCSILEELHLQGHPSPSVLNDLFPEIPMHALVKFKKDVMGVTTTKPEILPRPSAGTTAAEDTARLDGQDHRSPVSTSSSPSPGRAPPFEPAPSSPQALPASLLPLPPAYKLQQEKEKACEDPPASRSPSPENTADAKPTSCSHSRSK
ncbi:hypothetical protein A1Q2_06700 [Trichosporon asahii var. asahii CBS 8904]|uniref:Uncharacterized protein n=1 Tax=Trichosporon asahii var. asahii (strain CBS 8904) TaxID=1220162 RepID=K1VII7_TRIAC|nr:hypothetical protein A1Q2_06700 [Trichosporon asahii var. asahii CBS 8904]